MCKYQIIQTNSCIVSSAYQILQMTCSFSEEIMTFGFWDFFGLLFCLVFYTYCMKKDPLPDKYFSVLNILNIFKTILSNN